MKPKNIVIASLIVGFFFALGFALWREMAREEEMLRNSISGIVEVERELYATGVADIVKTDRLILYLVDPETRKPVAMTTESPLVPPQTIRIGQKDTGSNTPLQGSYILIGIVDKDGEIFKVSPGEVYGQSEGPVPIGKEEYRLVLNQPFRGSLFNTKAPQGGGDPFASMQNGEEELNPKTSLSGVIKVDPKLQSAVSQTDRVIILMFDPELRRPVAFKILPSAKFPMKFAIGLPPDAQGKPAYNLRVVTDKDNNPFNPVEGELVGRSPQPIPLGSNNLEFMINQPFTR